MSTSYTCARCRRHHDAVKACDPADQLAEITATMAAPKHSVAEADMAERVSLARLLCRLRRTSG